MKKTIATLALLTSASSAYALMPFPDTNINVNTNNDVKKAETSVAPTGIPGVPLPTTICLSLREEADGTVYLGSCDETEANYMFGLEIKSNGCAEDQAALVSYDIQIKSCPTFVQL